MVYAFNECLEEESLYARVTEGRQYTHTMGDKPSKAPLGLSGIVRLMHLAGASDEVTDNFIRLYSNEVLGSGLPPVIELGPVIALAAKEAARVATLEWLSDNQPQLSSKAKPLGGPSAQIYRLQINGKKTSVSLPRALYQESRETLGPELVDRLITELATGAPPDVRRSIHVQQGLRRAVQKAKRASGARASSGPMQ